ncbi:lumenal Hsp70 protein [Coemansia sp. RSA 1813]|nr:lumenal Hsp70 protein [Coemansia sp. RSA 1646]KAJ1767888.1 lumenal Hsp70 protein [Coemansia sp. RSA 1843]KAJ2089279.1 lumenal Hsp70 protein [Coemansia sp. RSA 986]KAJ2215108.1 lumenal Hsp70 protein [Coemansia sp. RSA 487]KAJ2569050.1 lumenal Hsp70 protein [Coemansia sp. RSA 1813]
MSLCKPVFLGLLLLLCILPPSATAAVLGIDFGTEWFTIALAKPGRPLDLVLNRDANRQTASVVTINGLERTFGSNAISIAPRLPEKTFMSVRNLLGVPFESDVAAAYRKQFPNQMIEDPELGTVAFKYGMQTNETLTVQEIVAMQLRHAQQLVKESEGVLVKDAVFTVPSFFDRSQRQAMLEAADLAGFRTLALVNDGSAVALNYAMNRAFSKPEKHLFYDMGAGKTVATVARFSMRQESKPKRSKKTTVINIQSFSSDATLGGQEIDFLVRDMLVERFAQSSRSPADDVKTSARAMNRLLKEAKRVKTILSANVEAVASVEGLYNGADLRVRITRSELEEAVARIVPRIRAPVDDALKAANATIADIDSIVLVGGGSRVPFVQRTLSDAFGANKLSRNVNAEEACVLGAVFKGATLSSHFKVRDMRLRDAMPYAVRGAYLTASNSLLGGTVQTTVYPYAEFGAVGARRVIRDFRSTDLVIEFEAKRSGSDGDWTKLATARISGVGEAATKLTAKDVLSDKPEVKVAIQTNEMSEFEVLKAEALFNVSNPGHAQYLADLAAWEKESASIDEEEAASTTESVGDDDAASGDSAKAKTKTKAKPTLRPKPLAQPEVITEVVKLRLDVENHSLSRLSSEAMERSRSLLKRMDDDDAARIARHSASNQLESLVYQLRDMAEDDDVIVVTSESQRKALEDAVGAASEWLEESAETAVLSEIEARIAALKELEEPINYRRTQRVKRAEHIDSLKSIIVQAEGLVSMYRKEYSAEELGPVVEHLQKLEDTLDDAVQWLESMTAQQEALLPHEDPVLMTADMDSKAVAIERSLTKLVAQQVKRIVESATQTQSETGDGGSDSDSNGSDGSTTDMSADAGAGDGGNAEHDEL